jgi:enamine deaminase RidA (YjgF/YER057c/UK114 family)
MRIGALALALILATVFPDATVGETRSLLFHVAVPSTDTTLDGQTRAELENLLDRDPGAHLVRLRVFAVGRDRLAAIARTVGAVLLARHAPLPALSLIGVTALPSPGELVAMESIAMGSKPVNPHGLAFLAGLAAATGDRTAGGLARVAREAGVSPERVMRVSCFYESPAQLDGVRRAMADTFPSAEALFVQSYGSADKPAVECEGVARLVDSVEGTRYINLAGTTPSPNFSRAALVGASRIVFTGTLVAVGDSAADMQALMERVRAVIAPFGASIRDVAMAGNYWLTPVAREALRPARNDAYGSTVPAATGIFVTTLAPAEGTVALELAVPLR